VQGPMRAINVAKAGSAAARWAAAWGILFP
jgi:hypothetical protein